MYQLVCRQSPFTGESEDEIYDAILEKEAPYPTNLPRVTTSFVKQLLTREPELRLGSDPTDAENVMKHEYFAGTDWDGLYHKRVPAPFIPAINSRLDISNFDPEYTSTTPVLAPEQSGNVDPRNAKDLWVTNYFFTIQFLPKQCKRISLASHAFLRKQFNTSLESRKQGDVMITKSPQTSPSLVRRKPLWPTSRLYYLL